MKVVREVCEIKGKDLSSLIRQKIGKGLIPISIYDLYLKSEEDGETCGVGIFGVTPLFMIIGYGEDYIQLMEHWAINKGDFTLEIHHIKFSDIYSGQIEFVRLGG